MQLNKYLAVITHNKQGRVRVTIAKQIFINDNIQKTDKVDMSDICKRTKSLLHKTNSSCKRSDRMSILNQRRNTNQENMN